MKLPSLDELNMNSLQKEEKPAKNTKSTDKEKGRPIIPKAEYDENGVPILNVDIDDTKLTEELNRFFGD